MSFDIGQAHVLLVKSAGDRQPVTTHALSGELYLSRSGWVLLNVPNALVRGAFAALNEPGAELPPSGPDGQLNAHISVMRPEELEAVGLTGESIKERGKHFKYTLGPVQEVVPAGWDAMSKCWFIRVSSPELKQLRRTYGLTPLPHNDEYDFHITIGVRRKGVLGTNEIRKAASLIHDPDGYFFKQGYVSSEATLLKQQLQAARQDVDRKPTPAQQEAGNYRKGHVTLHGLDIAIENPKGSTRSGVSPAGKKWSTKMVHDYGYFKNTKDKDGDPIDVFIGPMPHSELVFIINQVHPSGRFDEHKVMLGFVTADDAKAGYLANYEDGWQGLGGMVGMTMEAFKAWLDGDTTKRASVLTQAADDYWKSPKNKDGRKCPGCGELFKECEPLAGVIMCETCERFGPPKKAASDDPRNGLKCPHCGSTDTHGARAIQKFPDGSWKFANVACNGCHNGLSYDFEKNAASAKFRTQTSYDPICPHCNEVMHERHFVPDAADAKLWRHRGDCYDKGAFEIHWPDQESRDAEHASFLKQLGLDKGASHDTATSHNSLRPSSWQEHQSAGTTAIQPETGRCKRGSAGDSRADAAAFGGILRVGGGGDEHPAGDDTGGLNDRAHHDPVVPAGSGPEPVADHGRRTKQSGVSGSLGSLGATGCGTGESASVAADSGGASCGSHGCVAQFADSGGSAAVGDGVAGAVKVALLMPEEDNGRDSEEWADSGRRPTDRPNQSSTTTTTGTGITGSVRGANSSDVVGGSGSPTAVHSAAPERPFSEDSVLQLLQRAKQRSDQRRWQEKYDLIRRIMEQSPQDFVVDSPVGKYHGITHVPTQFRFHVPPTVYSGLLKSAEVWDSTWYGRAARDYFNNMLAGRQPLWHSGQGVLGNIGQHLGNVRDIASKRIAQAGAQQRLQIATDPDYALRHLSAYLGGRQQPLVSHPVDAVLHGRFGK